MAKSKKTAPVKAKKTPAKPAKPSKTPAKPAKTASAKPAPKAPAKSAKVAAKPAAAKSSSAAKTAAKVAPTKPAAVPKTTDKAKLATKAVVAKAEKDKKVIPAVDEKSAKASKQDKKGKTEKKARDEDADILEELDEEVEAISYGDAIRLTAQDLEDPEDVFLTDAEGRRYCKVKDCDQLSVVEGYCRFHYLSLWKKIQTRKKILQDGKLEKYIEELTSRYPDKYLEMIRRDLKTEKDFLSAIQELEIDDSNNEEFEEDSGFIDEVRGMGAGRGRGDESGGGDDY